MLLSKAYEIKIKNKMVIVGPRTSPSQLRYVGISPALIDDYQASREAYEAFVGTIETIRTYSKDDDVATKELQLFKGQQEAFKAQQEALAAIEKALTAKERATKKNERAKAWQRAHKDKQRVFVARSQARKYVKAYANKEDLNCLKDLINQRLNELN